MSRYTRNEGFGEIADELVFYDPVTGDFTKPATPNPIPEAAVDERRRVKYSMEPKGAAALSGVPTISWAEVERVSFAQINAFQTAHQLKGLLTGNAKTVKPRAMTGRTGKIVGMNLSPHFYPNLLNVMPVNPDTGAIDFIPTSQFQAFSGDTSEDALKSINGPGAKQELAKNDLLTFCAGSSRACRATCLVSTGQHAAGETHGHAKMRATYAFLLDPVTFVAVLHHQLKLFECECQNEGIDAVVRLNLLSDLPWYEICPELLEAHAGSLAWYDYTKLPFWRSEAYNALWRGRGEKRRNILDLTFSYSGNNKKECEEALRNGYRVAAVFASANQERKGVPGKQRTSFGEILESGLVGPDGRIELFGGRWLLVDGDASDYRIDDPGYGPGHEGCVVALNFKSSATIVGEFDPERVRKDRERAKRKALKQGKPLPIFEEPIVDRFAEARAKMAEIVRTKGGVPQSRFEYAKQEFAVAVPETERGKKYASALGRKYWEELFDEDEAASVVSKLSVDQVLQIEDAYAKASRRGGAKTGVPAAMAVLREFGIGVVGEGAPELPPEIRNVPMQPIQGTDIAIGAVTPIVAAD